MKIEIYNQIKEKMPKFEQIFTECLESYNKFEEITKDKEILDETDFEKIAQIIANFELKKENSQILENLKNAKIEKIANSTKLSFDEIKSFLGDKKYSKVKDIQFYNSILNQTLTSSKDKVEKLFED